MIQALEPDAEQMRLMRIAGPSARHQERGVHTGYELLKKQIAALVAQQPAPSPLAQVPAGCEMAQCLSTPDFCNGCPLKP